ncbi:MAG TPA: hypothetical protein VLA61_19980 [Ideonella sp.]|uniref:hypothetical protein n=1 Tax=Ideonella sp. TaxID=1929293 RepID=UPI002BA47E45|nr:hypothetical protein [Ideonella sp.]HSI50553.1 hypothetical protein [Ideonella sp.]
MSGHRGRGNQLHVCSHFQIHGADISEPRHRRRDVLASLGGAGLGALIGVQSPQADAQAQAKTPGPLWAPEALGERVWLDWRAEDLAEGPVVEWKDRVAGLAATQSDAAQQPLRTPDGVLFKSGGRRLTLAALSRAYIAHRAMLMIFRADFADAAAASGSFVSFNGYDEAPTSRQPGVFYAASGGTRSVLPQWRDPRGHWAGNHALTGDASRWHVVLTRRVNGTAYSSLDGGPEQASAGGMLCLPRGVTGTPGLIGDHGNQGPSWMLDCLLVLQDELSEADAQRLIAWGMWRKGVQTSLPADHRYADAAPKLSQFTPEPAFRETSNSDWLTMKAYWEHKNPAQTLEQAYRSELDLSGHRLVFEDHFTRLSITDEVSGAGPWWSPVHPAATGKARTARVAEQPATFVQSGSELTIRMQSGPKGWRSGVFTSVNLNGHGNAWKFGYFEFKARVSRGNGFGAWPAFWLKSVNEFFRLTESRLELDLYEGYCSDPKGHHQAMHQWPAARLMEGRISKRRSVGNYTGLKASRWGAHTVDLFDDAYHLYGMMLDEQWTRFYFDGLELARFPTPIEAKQPLFILVDLALLPQQADKASGSYELTLDYIRVYQSSKPG